MPSKNLVVKLDTSPLGNDNSLRGVGMYTRYLQQQLAKSDEVELWKIGQVEQPDVVHYPFFDLFFSTLPWRKQAPTVVTIHDVIPLIFPNFYPPGKRGRLRFWRQRFLAQRADAIITDSQASKEDIVKHLGIKNHKVHVIYLAANPELKAANEEAVAAARRTYHLPKHYALYVGDINYNKNIPQLIKAFKYLPRELHLVCVGKNFVPHEIPEWRWIEAQVAMSEVDRRVHFVSEISGYANNDLSAIYSGAAMYVQPSLYEGFGLPVLEAMQCKVPVVCTRSSSLVEIGGEEVVFTEPTAESLAEGIQSVLEWSENHRVERIRAAYKWSQQFSWTKVGRETMTVYRQVSKK